ncbi:MAG: helix-turn-helix domain-containing protein [Candidatus Pacearchaeota archaeon]
MKDIKEFLNSLGFSKNETLIYITLLETGASSVQTISDKTKIHRTNIYDALKKLVNRGLIYEIDAEKKLFSSKPLKSLKDFLKFREAELDEIIKNFELKKIQKKEDIKFKVSKGVFALREAISSWLDLKETINVFGIPGKAPEIIGPMLKKFHNTRIKRKILMRHIYNASAIDRVKFLNKLNYTEARVLPKKYDSNVTTIICKDKVTIFLWDDDVTVIEMQDIEIAKTYKNYFEILWRKAKKIK